MRPLLDLYTWHTPNGKKPGILLAELEVPYTLHLVDLSKGEQKRPGFLALSPNGKIPALVDNDSRLGRVTVFESGAILQYLAEKFGRFIPLEPGAHRAETLAWLFWQVGGPGPTFGKLEKYGRGSDDRNDAVYRHFFEDARRQVKVLDARLRNRPYIVDAYSVADIACYPWFEALAKIDPGLLDDADDVKRWLDRIGHRPAVRRGLHFEQVSRAA